MDFHQPDRHYCRSSSSTFQLTLSLHRRLTYKRSSTLQTNFSDNIMSSNYASCRVHSKSKKVRFDPSSEIHLYRHGNSEASQFCQSTTRPNGISTHDNLTIPNSDSSLCSNFPFSFGETQCCSRLHGFRLPSFMPASDVPSVSVDSHTYSRSPNFDYEFDRLSFEVVDRSQPIHSRDP